MTDPYYVRIDPDYATNDELLAAAQHTPSGRELVKHLEQLIAITTHELRLTNPNDTGMVGQAQGKLEILHYLNEHLRGTFESTDTQ